MSQTFFFPSLLAESLIICRMVSRALRNCFITSGMCNEFKEGTDETDWIHRRT